MADLEHLNIALPGPIADNVRRAVEGGEYATASEVIREALQLWQAQRELREREIDVLRRKWDEGKASGSSSPLDIRRLIAEERAKMTNTGGRG